MYLILALQVLAQPPPIPELGVNSSIMGWCILISAVASAIVTIINAIKGASGRAALGVKADVAAVKLDEIHTQTNSNLTTALNRITELEGIIRALTARIDTQNGRTIS